MELDEKVKLGEELARELNKKVKAGEWRRWVRYFMGKRNLEDAIRLAKTLGSSNFIRRDTKESYAGISSVIDQFMMRLNIPFEELLEVFGYAARHLTYLEAKRTIRSRLPTR